MIRDSQDPTGNTTYEIYDFPVVVTTENGAYIDWHAYEETNVVKRLEDGISLTEEQAQEVTESIHGLEKLYNYGNNRLDWEQRPDGAFYLEAIFPDAGDGLWMYLFSKTGDHEGTPMEEILKPNSKIDIHNVDTPSQAIFLVECLVAYYKEIGIQFPYIKGNQSGIETIRAGDHALRRVTRDYSFEIPWNNNFNYKDILSRYAAGMGIEMNSIENDYLETTNGSKVALVTTPQGKVWTAKNIGIVFDATKLFKLLSIPLKANPQYFA